jgi:antitoxin MazE
MEVSVINIGNSKGIRLSKTILEQYNISDKVEIILEKNQIIIRPKKEVRKNWSEAFSQMNENGEDQLLIDDVFEEETFE